MAACALAQLAGMRSEMYGWIIALGLANWIWSFTRPDSRPLPIRAVKQHLIRAGFPASIWIGAALVVLIGLKIALVQPIWLLVSIVIWLAWPSQGQRGEFRRR